MQYCIHMRGKSRGHGTMIFANHATIREAKEDINEHFKSIPSLEYAEIYDRTTGETIYRSQHDSEYRKAND